MREFGNWEAENARLRALVAMLERQVAELKATLERLTAALEASQALYPTELPGKPQWLDLLGWPARSGLTF